MQTVVLVLAGGRGERLAAGVPKAAATLAGRTLVARALALAGPLGARQVVVAPRDIALAEAAPHERVHDPGEGPLAAVVAAVAAWPSPRTWVLGVDLPFMDAAFLDALEASRGDAPAVAACIDGVLQPLPVCFDARGAAALTARHEAGERSLARALRALGVREVEATRLPGGVAALSDVDTPEDWAAAQRRLEGLRG